AFVLGGVYSIFGTSMRNALLFNSVLGAATTGLVYLIALRTFGRTAAIAASIAVAVLPGQLLIGDVALSETLYTFELVAFIALDDPQRRRRPLIRPGCDQRQRHALVRPQPDGPRRAVIRAALSAAQGEGPELRARGGLVAAARGAQVGRPPPAAGGRAHPAQA